VFATEEEDMKYFRRTKKSNQTKTSDKKEENYTCTVSVGVDTIWFRSKNSL